MTCWSSCCTCSSTNPTKPHGTTAQYKARAWIVRNHTVQRRSTRLQRGSYETTRYNGAVQGSSTDRTKPHRTTAQYEGTTAQHEARARIVQNYTVQRRSTRLEHGSYKTTRYNGAARSSSADRTKPHGTTAQYEGTTVQYEGTTAQYEARAQIVQNQNHTVQRRSTRLERRIVQNHTVQQRSTRLEHRSYKTTRYNGAARGSSAGSYKTTRYNSAVRG